MKSPHIIITTEIPIFGDRKTEVVQVLVILVLKGGSGAFCLKICDVLAQQDKTNFLPTLRSRLVVCKVRNKRTCLEFLQFFQVSLAASTNWCLKLNFYSISENKYNKFYSFSKEIKNGRF